MKQIKYRLAKDDHIELNVFPYELELLHRGKRFFAKYDFLKEYNKKLTSTHPMLFNLMLWMLYHNLEEIKLPEEQKISTGTNTIVSYSGGADSTALLYLHSGIPVHISREYPDKDEALWKGYESRQIRACNYVGSRNIRTNFERIRMMYNKSHGFNVGIGYAAMYFPILELLDCNTISFGSVFDDLYFSYADKFKYLSGREENFMCKTLKEYGVDVKFPLAGYSEVLTTKIADNSGIKNFSSCHGYGSENACRTCYKCFRKEAIRGRRLEMSAVKKLMPILCKRPLKMASSTIWAAKQAQYEDSFFRRYDEIDVSWCERINSQAQVTFLRDEDYKYSFPLQTKEDETSLLKFEEHINSPEIYLTE